MTDQFGEIMQYWINNSDQLDAQFVFANTSNMMLKINLDSGIINMQLFGRPDGTRPFNKDSYFKHICSRESFAAKHKKPFSLSGQEIEALQQELVLFLIRAFAYLKLDKYFLCDKDLCFILKALKYLSKSHEISFEDYIPLIKLVQKKARTLQYIMNDRYELALRCKEQGLNLLDKILNKKIEKSIRLTASTTARYKSFFSNPLAKSEKNSSQGTKDDTWIAPGIEILISHPA